MSIDAINTVPADEVVMKEKKQKKEKKDKKRKLAEAESGASTPAVEAAAVEEKPKKKSKKSKTAATETEEAAPVASSSATPASAEPADAAAPLGPDGLPLSKKQQKKMAKAAAAAAAAGPAAPLVVPTAFTPEHTAFLTENGITLTPHLFPPILSLQGANLPVSPKLLPYLSGFTKPTPIQSCSWPPLLAGRDVIGVAETGSGKTLSFSLPVLHALSQLAPSTKQSNQIKCLVLAPTRELALQTHATMQALGALVGVNAVCLFGGVGKDDQVRELRKKETRIVVGTPGRTLDLADQGEIDFSCITHLVLDEADRMLDAGFENDIRRIVAHCPGSDAGRQTVMFSATWPESVRRLASTFLVNPVKISVGSDELTANKRINQVVEVFESSREKDPRLLFHLRNYIKNTPSTPEQPTRILVFALYKKEATRLEQTIKRAGHLTAGLHGDLDQGARFKALDAFKTGKVNVLVATDVAARGLDIPDVGLVINVTFPLTTEDFVHRCGRTGRAGKSGKAVTFFTGENHERSLAGEFMRVLRDAGCDIPKEMDRFPSTIKKKEHGSYGAFYRDTTDAPAAKKITFD